MRYVGACGDWWYDRTCMMQVETIAVIGASIASKIIPGLFNGDQKDRQEGVNRTAGRVNQLLGAIQTSADPETLVTPNGLHALFGDGSDLLIHDVPTDLGPGAMNSIAQAVASRRSALNARGLLVTGAGGTSPITAASVIGGGSLLLIGVFATLGFLTWKAMQ